MNHFEFFRISPIKMNKLLLLLFLLLLLRTGITNSYGQDVISTNGGSCKSAAFQLDYTIGEPVIETLSSSSNTLTQGFQQSNLIVTAIDQIAIGAIDLKLYPNPVVDELMLETCNLSQEKLLLKLFDISGKLILQKNLKQTVEKIDMQAYRKGNYLLIVYTGNEIPLQSFKVIKY
jgi:hypothetical protein